MHEETRRLLSTLLRFLEGFDNSNMNKDEVNTKRSILICATNRKKDLDSVGAEGRIHDLGASEPIRPPAALRIA